MNGEVLFRLGMDPDEPARVPAEAFEDPKLLPYDQASIGVASDDDPGFLCRLHSRA
jgi:hypothetical protein